MLSRGGVHAVCADGLLQAFISVTDNVVLDEPLPEVTTSALSPASSICTEQQATTKFDNLCREYGVFVTLPSDNLDFSEALKPAVSTECSGIQHRNCPVETESGTMAQ